MKLIRGKHGQAMTELVIALPLIILLLGGMLQFFLVMQDKVKLGMLEHELMMFDSTAKTNKMNKMASFASEYALEIGLNPEKLTVKNMSVQDYISTKKLAGKALKWVMDFFPGVSDSLYGRDISVTYKVELMRPFKFLASGGSIELSTWIHSGVGDVWDMDMRPEHVLEMVFNKVVGGAKWLVKAMLKFFKRLL